jgi:hypothetical protein
MKNKSEANGGFAKVGLQCYFEHLRFDFPTFAQPKTVSGKAVLFLDKRPYMDKIFNLNAIPYSLTKRIYFAIKINLLPTWHQVFL